MTSDGLGTGTSDAPSPEPTPAARHRPRLPAPARLAAVAGAALLVAALVVAGTAGPAAAPAVTPSSKPTLSMTPTTVPSAVSVATPVVTPGPVLGRGGVPLPLAREVFGFLPYWTIEAAAPEIRYDRLSTIALFGIGIAKNGALRTKLAGYTAYTGETAARITAEAHARGVRVVPTFQLFDSKEGAPATTAFLGDPAAQQRFIAAALDLMEQRDADGAVLDFEPLPDRLTGSFALFAADFRRAIQDRDPTAHLTVALHQSASDAQVATIGAAVDRIFAMAYDYHWRGSDSAGPVAPLDGPGGDVRSTLERFVAATGPAKVILGVPYFGYDWPVAYRGPGATVNAPASENGGTWSVGYSAARDFLAKHPDVTVDWDPVAASPYFTYRDARNDTYRQVWYEDGRSVAAKLTLAEAAGVAGVGIWALGMDAGRDDLWDVLGAAFAKEG